MKVLNIVGTAREGRKSIHVAREVSEEFEEGGHSVETFDLKEKDISPLGNRTYKDDENPVPDDIEDLRDEVVDSDFILITTPEYNHSIPGVLKTALDHLYPEYEDKPFGFITVSGGGFGGVRGLSHLHDIVIAFGGFIGPSLPVSRVGDVFDEDGRLKDESYEDRFEEFVEKCEGFRQKLEDGIYE